MKGKNKMKLNSIYKYVVVIVLFAAAAFANGCHGVQW